jgi:putative salt-induced outer membrane protein YdiY
MPIIVIVNSKKTFLSTALMFLTLLSNSLFAQAIVNIEDMRREGEIGFFAASSIGLEASRGNRDRDFYSILLRFDSNTKDTESFLILQDSERKSNNKLSDKSRFLHARYILLGEDRVHWEIYSQYSENPFRNYQKRSVLGLGMRIILSDTARFGAGALKEDEKDLGGQTTKTDRLGLYLRDLQEVGENINFHSTLYLQPSVKNFDNDYKASIILGLDFNVNKNLKITVQYSSFHDSSPPRLAEKTDESLVTKFSYDLSTLWKD